MNWYLAQVFGITVVCILLVTVGWELYHLFEWFSFLSDDPLHYLRMSAYLSCDNSHVRHAHDTFCAG